jgi:glycosyltransferase XagB
MSNLRLHLPEPRPTGAAPPRLPLGRHLVNAGAIQPGDLVHALELQRRVDAPLGEILVAEGLVSRAEVLSALGRQFRAQVVDLDRAPPPEGMEAHLPGALCLAQRVVPWLRVGNTLMVATSRPDRFEALRACMGPKGHDLLPVIADPEQIRAQLARLYGREYAHRAATRVRASESCRGWAIRADRRHRVAALLLATGGLLLLLAPRLTLAIVMAFSLLTLVMTTTLKAAALWSQMSRGPLRRESFSASQMTAFRLPFVSVLVPLLREEDIAGALIARLSRLTYPKSLLEVVLVLEQSDTVTRDTIARTPLPDWMSVIEVPVGDGLTTKPRALNYALDFCRGSIIGVWDAEDRPEPDQIERVVTRFHHAPPEVACLQGVLDYYNARTNWIARCFTIEYASWWRILLPGIARLGLVIPLGGTTLFFRRDVLEDLGGWDAHNVTEDADLGLRLARHGYVTELLPTVTYEEANCRAWPWVRQRSRWLKGFLVTWCVHMRAPRRLWRDLGWRRFLGVQTMFLATFSQFLCAPLLWSFWLIPLGLPHPMETMLGGVALWSMAGLFMVAGLINMIVGLTAVSGAEHRHLMPWVLTMPFYFPMGALAALKALREFVGMPFYWDKTSHAVTHRRGLARLPQWAHLPALRIPRILPSRFSRTMLGAILSAAQTKQKN